MTEDNKDFLSLEERVGQFGFQEDEDSIDFFQTREGLKVLGERAAAINEEIEEEEEMAILLAEEAQREGEGLWGMLEAMAAKEAWHSRLEQAEEAHSKHMHHPSEAVDTHYETVDTSLPYDELLYAEQERANTAHRYDHYDQHLKEADAFIETLDPENKSETIDKLQTRLDALEKTTDTEAEAIHQLVDKGEYDEARLRLDGLNAKNLQIGALKDMMSVTKGDKDMYNNKGEKVELFKEADFIVPRDKKIVREGDDFFLLPKNEPLSYKNRSVARENFLRAKPEISSINKLVSMNRAIEMDVLDAEIACLSGELTQEQAMKANMMAMPDVGDALVHEEDYKSTPRLRN